MRPLPNIDVADLRAIAECHWDAVTAVNCSAVDTDRFDRFLATGVAMLCNGASDVEVGDYFVEIEIECLGIDTGGGIRERGQAFARALRDHLDRCERRELHLGG